MIPKLNIDNAPEWIYVHTILRNDPQVFEDQSGAVVASAGEELICVVGMPDPETIRRVAKAFPEAEILARAENHARVSEATNLDGERAPMHVLDGTPNRPPGQLDCRIIDTVPASVTNPELREELADALDTGKEIAAAIHEGNPVAFCYVSGTAPGYWDVAIDTIESQRRKGFAAHAFLHQYDRQRVAGLEPVWCAVESNAASLGLARKLGFRQIGECWLFERD